MSDAAPKPWVKALRIKSTPWRVLVGLWGHGSYKADGPAFVWVNRKKLAAEIGLPLGTLKNGLDALAALSWIVRDGGGWRLAWMTPGNFTRPADGPARPTGEPARPQADPAHGQATPARPQADPRPADGPHNLYGTSNYPPTNVVEARDLPPPPRSKPAQKSLVTGKPSASPLVTPSMAEAARRGVTGLDAMTANEKLAVYATPADQNPALDWGDPKPDGPPELTWPEPDIAAARQHAAARAQAQLDRERAEVRAKYLPTASDGVLTPAMLDALGSGCRDAWRRQAEGGQHGSWARAMRERADEFGLDLEAMAAAVFSAWERECAAFPRGAKPGQPSRKELWYSKHSAWLRAAALGDQEPEGMTPNGKAALEHHRKRQRERDAAETTRLAVVR